MGHVDIATSTIPELMRLRDVPQPAAHHPEIDTWVHVLMAFDQARALSSEPSVLLAVLLHDLGKALTPADALPRHVGHEEAGVHLVRSVCAHLGVPDAWTELALLVCEHHTRCHRACEMKGPGKRRLLRRLGAYEQRDRFELFLLACEADARGRLGLERRDYPQANLLRAALIGADRS